MSAEPARDCTVAHILYVGASQAQRQRDRSAAWVPITPTPAEWASIAPTPTLATRPPSVVAYRLGRAFAWLTVVGCIGTLAVLAALVALAVVLSLWRVIVGG